MIFCTQIRLFWEMYNSKTMFSNRDRWDYKIQVLSSYKVEVEFWNGNGFLTWLHTQSSDMLKHTTRHHQSSLRVVWNGSKINFLLTLFETTSRHTSINGNNCLNNLHTLLISVSLKVITIYWDVLQCTLKIPLYPQDGGSLLFWNISTYLQDYVALHPKRQWSSEVWLQQFSTCKCN